MEVLAPLLTLLALEIVLGIDNVIFIAILSSKLPTEEEQARARRLGIGLAVITRVLLLLSISWVLGLEGTLFEFMGNPLSGRDLILLGGGLFLIGKSTREIHEKLEAEERDRHGVEKAVTSMTAVIAQVMLVDVVFSLDSVITAVGIADELWIMITAIVVAAAVMVFFAGHISDFVEEHPTMKVLALAFLILIGSLLVIEGWNSEVAEELHLKNYAYFAMAFSVLVELINIRVRESRPIRLRNRPQMPKEGEGTQTATGD